MLGVAAAGPPAAFMGAAGVCVVGRVACCGVGEGRRKCWRAGVLLRHVRSSGGGDAGRRCLGVVLVVQIGLVHGGLQLGEQAGSGVGGVGHVAAWWRATGAACWGACF